MRGCRIYITYILDPTSLRGGESISTEFEKPADYMGGVINVKTFFYFTNCLSVSRALVARSPTGTTWSTPRICASRPFAYPLTMLCAHASVIPDADI